MGFFGTFFLPPLHDQDVKFSYATFFAGRKHREECFFLFVQLGVVPKNSTSGKFSLRGRLGKFTYI